MKLTIYLRLLLCMALVACTSFMQAQVEGVAPTSVAYDLFRNATTERPIELTYDKVPDFCFGHRKRNVFTNFSAEQLATLESYDYPKFKSRGLEMLEADIMLYQALVREWEQENVSRTQEIRAALGLN